MAAKAAVLWVRNEGEASLHHAQASSGPPSGFDGELRRAEAPPNLPVGVSFQV